MKIAVIDDDSLILELIKDFFNTYYSECIAITFENCESFLANSNIDSYDLIIVDFSFPGMSGREFCELVRSKHKVPIIMITAQGTSQLVRDLFYHNLIDDFIDKPFDHETLLMRASKILSKRKDSYIWIKDISGSAKIKVYREHIDYITTSEKQKIINVVTNHRVIETRGLIRDFSCCLDDNIIKLSRKLIVNLKNIELINYKSNLLEFSSSNRIKIPKTKLNFLEDKLNQIR